MLRAKLMTYNLLVLKVWVYFYVPWQIMSSGILWNFAITLFLWKKFFSFFDKWLPIKTFWRSPSSKLFFLGICKRKVTLKHFLYVWFDYRQIWGYNIQYLVNIRYVIRWEFQIVCSKFCSLKLVFVNRNHWIFE